MRLIAGVAVGVLCLATIAHAQQPSIDPRLAGPMVQAQMAELALRDAAIRALQEDAQKREKDLSEWFKGWFGPPEPAK